MILVLQITFVSQLVIPLPFTLQIKRDVTRIKQRSPNKSSPLKLPPLKAPKQDTSNPFPMLTSKEIGWRSGRRECSLEVYGRWGRPKYSIINQLRWPNDAVP